VRKKLKLLEDEKVHLRHKYSENQDEFQIKYSEYCEKVKLLIICNFLFHKVIYKFNYIYFFHFFQTNSKLSIPN